MRLVLIDDHPMVLQGVSSILSSQQDMEVVGMTSSGKEGLRMVLEMQPDVAVVDLRIGKDYGLDIIRQCRQVAPGCRFIVLTSFSDRADIKKAVAEKVEGYILKEATPEEIIGAIRLVACGRNYVNPAIMQELMNQDNNDPIEQLTPREIEVLGALARGMSNRDIARALFITEYTVKKHVSQILEKLDFSDRTQAALFAYSKGIGNVREFSFS